MINKKSNAGIIVKLFFDIAKETLGVVEDMLICNSYIDRSYLYDPMQREQYLINKKKSFKNKQAIYSTVNYLKKKKYIKVKENTLCLTKKAVQEISLSEIEDIVKEKQKIKWDGKWRVILFDIPEKNRQKRYLLRSALKRFKFKKCQKSVWVSKLPVSDQLVSLCKLLSVKKYVVIFEVDTIIFGFL